MGIFTPTTALSRLLSTGPKIERDGIAGSTLL
jgi:hypothetical protein